MKILQVITSLQTGGAESLIAQIVPRMIADGLDVEVALFDGSDTPFRRRLEAAGVKIHTFAVGGSVYNPLHILRLRRLMRRFDIVHTHNTAPQLFAAIGSVLCSVVLCTTEHNTSNRRRRWKWYAPLDRWMYSRYRHIICISQKAEDNLRDFIGSDSDKISTVNNGIDTAAYRDAAPSPDLRKGLPDDARIITMVAGFRWEKDQPTLIRAVSRLPERFHLFLVGDGVNRPACEQLAADLGAADRVHFLGLSTDVPSILRASDYVAMSSHFEGLSLSSLEGMAAGRPMLASDVDGLREVVGGAGILFPHEDAEALANAISRLDADPALYARTAAACAARAADYDITHMVAGYEQIYHTLAPDK